MRKSRICLNAEDVVGIITTKEMSELKWELQGSFSGNNVYKLIKKQKYEPSKNV